MLSGASPASVRNTELQVQPHFPKLLRDKRAAVGQKNAFIGQFLQESNAIRVGIRHVTEVNGKPMPIGKCTLASQPDHGYPLTDYLTLHVNRPADSIKIRLRNPQHMPSLTNALQGNKQAKSRNRLKYA